MIRFQLLGHVSARSERGQILLGSARQRAVLAALLVEPATAVSLDQLVDRVWGATPPRSARQTLHSYMSRLRGALDDEDGPPLVRRSGGYVLEVEESAVDLQRFRALMAQARRADDAHADALWQKAMDLWRGRPFADLDSDWLRSVAVRIEAEHLAAVLDHNDVLLRLGEHARLMPSVADAARAHPLDERLAGQLMLGLYRCGRQADALAHFRLVQERLAHELGSEPGPTLCELHQQILRHDDELAAPTAVSAPGPDDEGPSLVGGQTGTGTDRSHRPAQLPLDVPGFTGRSNDLQRLDELLPDAADDRAPRRTVTATISGTAGVGKTALTVHWAHRVADRFPDGQLYVNLRGYDPEQPMRSADALARFLTALGVPERDIPLDPDERAARYRTEVADRQLLIVLDNASSAHQVRPLLPGSGASMVVVTSRDSLAGLAAVHGAHQIDLDLLPAADAVELLRRLIGQRVDAEPRAAETLAEQCARLPLALRVAAVLATPQPGRPLAEVVAELADRQERLELLDPGGDPYAAVHAVFSWSIQHLPEQSARTFRRLGLHPGPDLDQYVAAALTGLAPNRARHVVETLVSAHLLYRTGPGRYGMHDLLRAYAIYLAAVEDTDGERREAEERLLGYYQASAFAAVGILYPGEVSYRPLAVDPGTPIPDLTEPGPAHDWLRNECFCLVAIVEHAADQQRSGYVVGLARILYRHLVETNLTGLVALSGHALRAAEDAGDLNSQAHALCQLGIGHFWMGQDETASDLLRRALTLYRQVGNLVGEARTLTSLSQISYQRGGYESALDDLRQAIALYRQVGDRLGESKALNGIGLVEERLGNYAQAVEIHQRDLVIIRDLGVRSVEPTTLNNLASAELGRGRHSAAAEYVRQSLAVIEELGNPTSKAHALDTLGTLYLRLGEPASAGECFQRALAHFRQIGKRGDQAWSINGLGEVAQFNDDPVTALHLHTDALTIATEDALRHQQARAHAGVGHAHRALGDQDRARTHYEHAYLIYTELDMPDAEEMLTYMNSVIAA